MQTRLKNTAHLLPILLLLLFTACAHRNDDRSDTDISARPDFHITLYDSDYSLAFTRIYNLNADSIKVTFSGGLENETPQILLDRPLTEAEQRNIDTLLNSIPWQTLQPTYMNPNIDDGDQKTFGFTVGNTQKWVHVANTYQKDLASIVTAINGLVPPDLKITYENTYPDSLEH